MPIDRSSPVPADEQAMQQLAADPYAASEDAEVRNVLFTKYGPAQARKMILNAVHAVAGNIRATLGTPQPQTPTPGFSPTTEREFSQLSADEQVTRAEAEMRTDPTRLSSHARAALIRRYGEDTFRRMRVEASHRVGTNIQVKTLGRGHSGDAHFVTVDAASVATKERK
jgi:hypothetical protein